MWGHLPGDEAIHATAQLTQLIGQEIFQHFITLPLPVSQGPVGDITAVVTALEFDLVHCRVNIF